MSRRHNSRSRKPAGRPAASGGSPGGAGSATAQVELEEENPFADVHYDFVDVGFDEQFAVDERQLQLLMQDWRKGRATRSIWQALSDGYVTVFTVAVIAAMLVGGIRAAQQSAAGCTTVGCQTARGLLPWLLLTGVMVAALGLTRLFGPVVASAAEGFWLLDAPVSRARVLRRRLWSVILAAGVLGAVSGALVSLLTGLSGMPVLVWTVAAGLSAAALTAFAAAEQGAERTWLVQAAQVVVSVAALAVMLAVIATAAGWIQLPLSVGRSEQLAIWVMVLAAVVLVVSWVLAAQRLNNIRRARLVSGGDLMTGLQGAGFALDFALMRDILVSRHYQEVGQVKPVRGRGVGSRALVWRDVQRLWRNPRPLVLLAVSIVVPYALTALGVGRLTGPLSALVLFVIMIPFFDSLRVLSRTKGLARAFPMNSVDLRTAASTVPAILAGIWGLCAAPAFVFAANQPLSRALDGVLAALAVGAAGYLAGMRWVSAGPPDYNGPMMSTGAGAMPPGIMFNMVRGLDMVAVVTFPLIFNWSPWISLVIAFIAWTLLRQGGLNQQEMLEASQESRKELAAMRVANRGENQPKAKQVVTRSTTSSPRRVRPPLK